MREECGLGSESHTGTSLETEFTDRKDREAGDARPLNHVEAVGEGLRFDEVDGETPCEIGGEEGAEDDACAVGLGVPAIKNDGERGEEDDFVELGGVAGDAVTEVDAPRERGGGAVGVVGEAGEEAADAADGNTDAERDGEEVSGAGADAGEELDEFDGEPAAEKPADDGFASAGFEHLSPMKTDAGSLLEEAEDAAASECADCGGGDD